MTATPRSAALIGSVAVALAAHAASAALVVTEVASQTTSGTAATINGDWWELTNTGDTAIDLAGYQWADTEDALSGPTATPNFFPSILINSGQSIIILEEVAANEAAWRANWGLDASVVILGTDEMLDNTPADGDTFSGLGNPSDAVFFYNPAGVLVSSYSYSATIRGTSFEADRSGNDLGFSVLGENGAVRGLNGDTASPGTSVPVPAALPVLALGLAVAGGRRRNGR